MAEKDFDQIQIERIRPIAKRLYRNGYDKHDLFVSEYASKTIDSEKVLLRSYRPDDVLAMLPFSEHVYVSLCSACVKKDELSTFKKLVERRAIFPVLFSQYKQYPESVRDIVTAHEHISVYEYDLYRQFTIHSMENRWVCQHCVEERSKSALAFAKNSDNFDKFEMLLERLHMLLAPYVAPDIDLLDAAVEACKENKLEYLEQIAGIGEGLYAVRTAQAFDAPIILRPERFSELPKGVIRKSNEIDTVQAEMKKFALDGLGLRIPTDIGIEQYLELIGDYRPALREVVGGIVGRDLRTKSTVSMLDVQKEVARINSEIERVKGLRRSVVLNACLGFYRDNPTLVNTGLLMCAIGLTGSLWGCAAAGGAQVVKSVAKSISGAKENKKIARLKEVIERDLQPHLVKLIATYAGSDTPTVAVLSLQRIMADRIGKAQAKGQG